jgi:hypothetical protein
MKTFRIALLSIFSILTLVSCGEKGFGVVSSTKQQFIGGPAGSPTTIQYTIRLRASDKEEVRVARAWAGTPSAGYFTSFGFAGDKPTPGNIMPPGNEVYDLTVTEVIPAKPDPRGNENQGLIGPVLIPCPEKLPSDFTTKGIGLFIKIGTRDSVIVVQQFEELEKKVME